MSEYSRVTSLFTFIPLRAKKMLQCGFRRMSTQLTWWQLAPLQNDHSVLYVDLGPKIFGPSVE